MTDIRQLELLQSSIRLRGPTIDTLATELRTPAIVGSFDKWNHDSWCISVAGDALVRLRQLTEQDFGAVEPMGIVASARYIFELAIWLRLFARDRRYGLVYFHQLLATQLHFYKATLTQIEREIGWLKSLEGMEAASHDKIAREAKTRDAPASDIASMLTAAASAIDAEAARRFSIYAESAQSRGYGFQAYLIEKQALPQARQTVAAIDAERAGFESQVTSAVKAMCPKKWQWRSVAREVGQLDQYDYIYGYASKLLHATPASITTDAKRLEVQERELFLRYIDVTITDILTLASVYRPSVGSA